jgi:hypothetical protein
METWNLREEVGFRLLPADKLCGDNFVREEAYPQDTDCQAAHESEEA